MAPTPFTHHEILGLIEPFARAGRSVDLARTDRLARRLVFRPIDHAADGDGTPAHRETLELDLATPGVNRLIRTLDGVEGADAADGLAATLWIEGDDRAALLARVAEVSHGRQLRVASGCTIALSHWIDGAGDLRLLHGFATAGGLVVRVAMPVRGGRRADIALTARLDDPIELPDDLLGVLGRDWSRLDRWTERTARRWTGVVRLHRRRGERATDADAERRLERAALHVAATLADVPGRFHDRHVVARWTFAFRRAIPFLVCIALIVGALAFTKAGLSHDSVFRMLIFNAPPLMLVAFFCLRELPRIEWPRRPRRLRGVAWRGDVATVPLDGRGPVGTHA